MQFESFYYFIDRSKIGITLTKFNQIKKKLIYFQKQKLIYKKRIISLRNQRIKYFTKDPRNFKIAADFAAPEGWLLGQMYRAWDAGHKNYKPIYDTINGKKKIVGFTDNQFGKGQTYFALKKYTKKFNGTPMSDHPDFKNTKKFIDIANRAKLPPNKVITDLLIKGGIEDNRVTLNTLLNYMVNEKGIEPTKRALYYTIEVVLK